MAKKLNYLPITVALFVLISSLVAMCGVFRKDVLKRPETVCTAVCSAWDTAGCLENQSAHGAWGESLGILTSVSQCISVCDAAGGIPPFDVACLFATQRCDQVDNCLKGDTDVYHSGSADTDLE